MTRISKHAVPVVARRHIKRLMNPAFLGSLRRTTPLSRSWGFDRGTPVDRYYIERFLAAHRQDIRGRVLEVKDSTYTNRYGSVVSERHVLDIDAANPDATIIADLTAADHVAADQFDCFILTQTLHLIYDTRSALHHAHRLLRPGGTLLVTVPSVSRISAPDYWRFTRASCAKLFAEQFGSDNISIEAHGNVLVNVAFLEGMAHEELSAHELEVNDEQFPLVVTVRAVKTGPTACRAEALGEGGAG